MKRSISASLLFAFILVSAMQAAKATDRAPAPEAVHFFLSQHWKDPLSPQGDPPAGFSANEASLAPEACGQCHVRQYRDWRQSLHSHTMGPGIRWQFTLMSQADANKCLRCHAPLAEQKALVARERGWNAPASAPPAYVPDNLHTSGLICAGCHVRGHVRFGPPAKPGRAAATTQALPHAGFVANAAFTDSRFCANCHQFNENGPRLNGKLLENTYAEWRASPAARAGRTCQSCHMPDRRHLWRGIHDPDMTRAALSVKLDITPGHDGRMQAQATIRNTGAGHHFPTYLVPQVVFTLELVSAEATRTPLASSVIGRQADVYLTQELADTRIAADAAHRLTARFVPPGGGGTIELRMHVAPGEHYERVFDSMLSRAASLPRATVILLREAAAQTRAHRYDAVLARAPLPAHVSLQIAHPARP